MRAILISFFSLFFLNGFGQYDFEHLTTLDGLSQNDINFIHQDSKGFMWFGTVDGLNRYDGMSFTIYQKTTEMDHPIGSNLPFCIAENTEGNFWIGTSDAGVWFFDTKQQKFSRIPAIINGSVVFPDTKISSICLTSDGLLWASSASGLSVLDIKGYEEDELNGRFLSADFLEKADVDPAGLKNGNFLKERTQGGVFYGANHGLYIVETGAGLEINVSPFQGTPTGGQCLDAAETDDGFIVSFFAGVYSVRPGGSGEESGRVQKLHDIYLTDFAITHTGDLWGGNSNGLYHLKFIEGRQKLEVANHFKHEFNNDNSLSKNRVVDVYEDRSGLLWIGTNGGGLNKLDLNKKKFDHVHQTNEKGSLSYDKVRDLHEDRNGNLWVGTEGGGISFLPYGSDDYFNDFERISLVTQASGQNTAYCFSNIPGSENKVLFGAGYPHKLGVITVEGKKIKGIKYFKDFVLNSVFSSSPDGDGNLWLCTYGGGLYHVKYDVQRDDFVLLGHYQKNDESGFSSNIVRSVIEDHQRNIWVGTDNGLNLLTASQREKEDPRFTVFQYDSENDSSIAHDYILPLYCDAGDDLWVGTMGGGLCKVNRSEAGEVWFTRYSSRHGLPNDVIKAIEEDSESNLWISSNRGITRFNPESGEIRNYNVADGLQDYEFSELSSLKRENGKLFFGGVNGFNAFFPSQITDNQYFSQLEFTELYILNDRVLPGEEYNGRIVLDYEMPSTDSIKLKYSENSFSVGFSALHYAAPEKINYKYHLQGFDDGWVNVNNSNPRANYTNIPPGEYTLKVLATNNDGVWNPVPSTLVVEVVPPFWQTDIALALYVVIIVIMLMFFRRYSIIGATRKNELLMEHFEQEKTEELMQMKLQFFTNISHEFRTPLTLIKAPLEKLIVKKDELSDQEKEKSYTLISKNVAVLNRLIDQLMDFRKLEKGRMPLAVTKGNIVDLVQGVFESFSEIAKSKNIHFNLENQDAFIELWFDSDKIEKILFNLLSNAFKFTPQGGSITVRVNEIIDKGEEWVKIDVKDNGVGISPDKLPMLFERFFQGKNQKLSNVSGTGIGLAFAKSLIELHNGDIKVFSQPDVETIFSVFLKKGKLHFAEKDFSEVPDQNAGEKITYENLSIPGDFEKDNNIIDPSKDTVLIVEDNYEVQNLLKDCFGYEFNVVQAFDGKEGLVLCREVLPDLIISDVMMPEMNGYEMCREVKEDEEICHIPVIMLTAKSTDEEKLQGLTEGAEAYIPKPFNIDVLVAQAKSILEARKLVRDKFSRKLDVEPQEVTFTSVDEKLLDRLLKVVEENINNPEFTVVQLAEKVGMGQAILNKKLKALLGQTAKAFIRTIRLKRAAQLLKLGRLSITDVVYEVGFNDMKYFRECFRKQFNVTPSDYIRHHKEENEEGLDK